jgi:hypothetical protein
LKKLRKTILAFLLLAGALCGFWSLLAAWQGVWLGDGVVAHDIRHPLLKGVIHLQSPLVFTIPAQVCFLYGVHHD